MVGLPIPVGSAGGLPGPPQWQFGGESRQLPGALPDFGLRIPAAGRKHSLISGADTAGPVDGEPRIPVGEERHTQRLRQGDYPLLAGTHPLAAVIDKGVAVDMLGQGASPYPLLGLQHQHP